MNQQDHELNFDEDIFWPTPEVGMKKVSAVVVPQRVAAGSDREILLGYNREENWYELPGGKNKNRETVERTARRELAEEVGWPTDNLNLHFHSNYEGDPEWLCAVFYLFFKSHEESLDAPGKVSGDKFTEWLWVPQRVAAEMVLRPVTKDLLRYMGLYVGPLH